MEEEKSEASQSGSADDRRSAASGPESDSANAPAPSPGGADAKLFGLLPVLAGVPRPVSALLALLLFGLAAWLEFRTTPVAWSESPHYLAHWLTPRQLYAERTLPAFEHATIQSVEVVPQSGRLWIAGDAGLLASSDDDGATWTTFHYDVTSGTMLKDAPHRVATELRLITWRVEADKAPGAELQGRVSDPSGAAVVGATIRLTNLKSGFSQTTSSAKDGSYSFRDLPPGAYELRVTQPGFKTYQQKTSDLQAGKTGVMNVLLSVGDASQTNAVVLPAERNPNPVQQYANPSVPAQTTGQPGKIAQTIRGAAAQPSAVSPPLSKRVANPPARAHPPGNVPSPTREPPHEPPDWIKVEFYNSKFARLVAPDAFVVCTEDAGETWTHVCNEPSVRVRPTRTAVLFSSDLAVPRENHANVSGAFLLQNPERVTAMAPGEDRQLRIMGPAGVKSASGVNAKIYGVTGQDPSEFWAAGESGKDGAVIYHSGDRGASWTKQFSKSGFGLRDIVFRENGKSGFAAGTRGAVVSTRDGGQYWEPLTRGALLPENLGFDYRWWQQPVRVPAPFSMLAIFFGLCFLFLALFAGAVPRAVEQTIASITVSDAPVVSTSDDTLGFGPVARAISGLLRNRGTKLPITLAITAKWGRGKTSLMSMVQQDLKAAGWRTVWFNAWHHQEELSLLASLLQTVRQKAPPVLLERGGLRYRLKLLAARLLRWQTLWVAAACLVLYNSESALHERHPRMYGCTAQYLYERSGGAVQQGENLCTPPAAAKPGAPSPEPQKSAADKPGILEFLMRLLFDAASQAERLEDSTVPGVHIIPLAVLSVLVMVLGWQILESFGANPAEMLTPQTAQHSVSELEARTNFLEKFRKQYADVVEALGRYRLVVLVDDLDRCRPRKISEMLEAANYLMAAGPCALVMALEESAVISGLGLSFQRMAEEMVEVENVQGIKGDLARYKRQEFARNYVEKLLNVVVQVPSMDDKKFRNILTGTGKKTETRAELRTRRMRRFASLARVPAAAIIITAIILFGGDLIRQELLAPAPAAPAQTGVQPPANPVVAPPDNGPATGGAAKTVTGPPRPPQVLAVYAAPQTPLPGRWFTSWGKLLAWGCLLIAFAATLLARRPPPVTRDSAQFQEALQLWAPVLAEVNPSPRYGKRVLNRLRYLAMLDREAELDQSPAAPGVSHSPRRRIPETLLVALGVMEAAKPGTLNSSADFSTYLAGMESTLQQGNVFKNVDTARWYVHKEYLDAIPAAQLEQYRQRYLDLSAGITAR
jgi:Carboxypeptidase regulatory-like domain/KAP family P-loop domain